MANEIHQQLGIMYGEENIVETKSISFDAAVQKWLNERA